MARQPSIAQRLTAYWAKYGVVLDENTAALVRASSKIDDLSNQLEDSNEVAQLPDNQLPTEPGVPAAG